MMRKGTLLGLFVAAVVALGCGAAGGGEEATGDAAGGQARSEASGGKDSEKEAKEPEKVAGIGDPVRDGKFEFVVQKVKCGVSRVGNNLLGERAQGQFCLVTLKVKNIGKEPQAFTDGAQKAYAADGTEYSTNSSASIYANDEDSTLFNEINPGNGITGVIVFDIPKDAKLDRLELHDSHFSGGVTVKLT